jgi:hypothetical protein
VAITAYKRFLKYRLHPADVLFFRWIPGTRGETLYPFLERHFPADVIFPPYSAPSDATFTTCGTQALSRVRLVRGDFEYGTGDRAVYRYISRSPIKITFLCHPVRRATALYQEAISQNQLSPDATLLDYVNSPAGRAQLCNGQAKAVTGHTARAVPGHATLGYSLEAFQKLAEDNLEQHHFFGLAEEAKASLQLLHYTFDWELSEPPAQTAGLEFSYSPAEEAAICAQAGYDVAFYSFAASLFRRRYRQLVDELLEIEATARKTATPIQTRAAPGILSRFVRAVQRRLFKRKLHSSGSRKKKRRRAKPDHGD